jgi:hypothetical protein
VLVRNAHSVAVSDGFFAFQKQIQQFFCLLQGISLDRAKTEKSLRTLPLLPSVEDLLLRMKTQQEDFEKIYGARYVCLKNNQL